MIREFWSEFPAAVREIDEGSKARVLVVSSTGKHFTAGIDLNLLQNGLSLVGDGETEVSRSREAFLNEVRMLQRTFSVLDDARIPVIAAIQGGCIGGGVDLATACDMRYATEDAFFCIQEINVGLTADVGTFPRICHLLPLGVVKELAYTGDRFPAAQAKALGFVNEVYPTHEAMMDAVMQVAGRIAQKSPLAIEGSKVMINRARDHSIPDMLENIALWNSAFLYPTDVTESMVAMGEKRAPDYRDLEPVKKSM
jgi:enoyl-CoA hydratase